jgi:hypothetical protein
MTALTNELFGKQLGLLHELLPQASHFGLLSDPKALGHESTVKDAQAAASAIGCSIEVLTASTSGEIDEAFARIANEKRVQGLLPTVLFLFPHVFSWSFSQLALRFPRFIRYARLSRPAGC